MTAASRPLEIAVVGAGNIGSRHLQALARLDRPARIYAVDLSEPAARLAAARFAEIAPRPDVVLFLRESVAALPRRLDMAVIATGAATRLAALAALLARCEVELLVLEKFLFQRHADYAEAERLLARPGMRTVVNTPRRLWPDWRRLRDRFVGRGPLTVAVETSRRNGMASNAIHFLDLAAFLCGAAEGFALRGDRLAPSPDAARRGAATEFSGVLVGFSAGGDLFAHRSRLEDDAPHAIAVSGRGLRVTVDETGGRMIASAEETGWTPVETPFSPVFQSALTHRLLEPEEPSLPDYAESARLHRQCLGAFLEALGENPLAPGALCPVT